MQPETVTYDADGLTMQGQIFVPPGGGGRPGVIVFPDGLGLGPHAIERSRRLAELGHVALAADLHGQGRLMANAAQMMAALAPLMETPEPARARAQAALAVLTARPEVDGGRLAAIGFCIGGTMAFELARMGAALRVAVGFHGGLATKAPATAGGIKARMLACLGAEDPLIPAEQRASFEAEMRAAGADWQIHLYGDARHSFTEPEADRRGPQQVVGYNALADRRSWASMLALFAEAGLSPA